MNTIINKDNKIKDREKGQKIVAAVYLVTKHLSDTDPMKNTLRTTALEMLVAFDELLVQKSGALTDLLQAATYCGILSEKNASIIMYEAKKFAEFQAEVSEITPTFFSTLASPITPQKDNIFKKQSVLLNTKSSYSGMSFSTKPLFNKEKSERGETIMSFMKDKKSATIKDITTLFPTVSDKTIQREMSTLVALGKLSKRGNKRWSVYLLV